MPRLSGIPVQCPGCPASQSDVQVFLISRLGLRSRCRVEAYSLWGGIATSKKLKFLNTSTESWSQMGRRLKELLSERIRQIWKKSEDGGRRISFIFWSLGIYRVYPRKMLLKFPNHNSVHNYPTPLKIALFGTRQKPKFWNLEQFSSAVKMY